MELIKMTKAAILIVFMVFSMSGHAKIKMIEVEDDWTLERLESTFKELSIPVLSKHDIMLQISENLFVAPFKGKNIMFTGFLNCVLSLEDVNSLNAFFRDDGMFGAFINDKRDTRTYSMYYSIINWTNGMSKIQLKNGYNNFITAMILGAAKCNLSPNK